LSGLSELPGAVGLVMPGILAFPNFCTVVSAIGLIVLMIAASVYHYKRKGLKSFLYCTLAYCLHVNTIFLGGRWQRKCYTGCWNQENGRNSKTFPTKIIKEWINAAKLPSRGAISR
jgi:hypothetical protein